MLLEGQSDGQRHEAAPRSVVQRKGAQVQTGSIRTAHSRSDQGTTIASSNQAGAHQHAEVRHLSIDRFRRSEHHGQKHAEPKREPMLRDSLQGLRLPHRRLPTINLRCESTLG